MVAVAFSLAAMPTRPLPSAETVAMIWPSPTASRLVGTWKRVVEEATLRVYRPRMTWALLRRVLAYGRPYRWQIAGMLVLILTTTGLGLLTPLVTRDLIDRTLPQHDVRRLIWLALLLLAISSADLNDLRSCSDGFCNVRVHLVLVAVG